MSGTEALGRCQGCGENVPMTEVDSAGGHTVSEHHWLCNGYECAPGCPVPVHCGPVDPPEDAESRCVACGCTDTMACPEGCAWIVVERDTGLGVCTACAPNEAAARTLLAAQGASEAENP